MGRLNGVPAEPADRNRPSVLFAINHLGRGGAESHTLRVLNYLDRTRYRPLLGVVARGGSYEDYLRPDVEILELAHTSAQSSTARQVMSAPGLRRLVVDRQPDIVLLVMDFMAIIGTLTLKSLGPKRPKIVPVVQIPPSIEYASSAFGRRFVLPAIRRLYTRTDRVIALSHGVRDDLIGIDARLRNHITVIHNACVDDRTENTTERVDVPTPDAPVILGAGRLITQKGFTYLIDAFAEVRRQTPAELWILGEGPDRSLLERRIAEHGLGSSVRLLGFQRAPHAFMRKSAIFCLSSIYEGFGNVVVEAMACGLPVVSTDCPYGPSEIIRDENEGLLVPTRDVPALARSLARLLRDRPLRDRLAQSGLERAKNFHAAQVAREYADEMDRIRAGSRRTTS
ncbi:MAG: glycosyltransferase [Polyangiaceae bacterium]|nr:glycosyltransferase [Polyangiaceae bacterium]